MKKHIDVDIDCGLFQVIRTPANESDVDQSDLLLYGKQKMVHGELGVAVYG